MVSSFSKSKIIYHPIKTHQFKEKINSPAYIFLVNQFSKPLQNLTWTTGLYNENHQKLLMHSISAISHFLNLHLNHIDKQQKKIEKNSSKKTQSCFFSLQISCKNIHFTQKKFYFSYCIQAVLYFLIEKTSLSGTFIHLQNISLFSLNCCFTQHNTGYGLPVPKQALPSSLINGRA